MFGTLKRFFFATMLLGGIASVFISLGTLNGRVPGGFTLHNTPWSIAVGVFGVSVVMSFILKLLGPLFDEEKALH
jgi:hypothetical protein